MAAIQFPIQNGSSYHIEIEQRDLGPFFTDKPAYYPPVPIVSHGSAIFAVTPESTLAQYDVADYGITTALVYYGSIQLLTYEGAIQSVRMVRSAFPGAPWNSPLKNLSVNLGSITVSMMVSGAPPLAFALS